MLYPYKQEIDAMVFEDRVEDGVQFRVVNECPLRLPQPHWVAESGKPVTVFPPLSGSDEWYVYAPLCGSGNAGPGFHKLAGDQVEERAFCIASGFANQA